MGIEPVHKHRVLQHWRCVLDNYVLLTTAYSEVNILCVRMMTKPRIIFVTVQRITQNDATLLQTFDMVT